MNEQFTKEQFRAAYRNAPDQVLAVFEDETITQVVEGLQQSLQLHVDAAGMLAKEVGYLLLGLIDPAKFAERLKANGFSDQMVNDIAIEINQKIFAPLRAQMEKGIDASPSQATAPETTSAPVQPVVPVVSVPQYSAPAVPPPATVSPQPAPVQAASAQPQVDTVPSSFAPPLQSPRYLHTETEHVFVSNVREASPVAPAPHPSAPQHASAAPRPQQGIPQQPVAPVRPAPSQPSAQYSTHPDERLLEDHEEPHFDFKKTVTPAPLNFPQWTPPAPRPAPAPAAVPANLPGAMPSVTAAGARFVPPTPSINRITPASAPAQFAPPPPPPPRPVSPTQTFPRAAFPSPAAGAAATMPAASFPAQPQSVPPPVPPAKPYSTDPYREPLA